MRTASCVEALREALALSLERDRRVFLLGEDLGVYGGAFGVTRGLLERFGPERVVDTPICELGFTGAAVGAALAGSRPVVEIMFMDFVTLAMDPVVNLAAKARWVYGPDATCPLVLRVVAGAGRSYGPTHSQSLEAWFMHVPGLKVLAPATPEDHAGLFLAAVRDDGPVVFLEHKMLYGLKGPLPEKPVPLPPGRARLARPGKDLTIVAWSWMVQQSLLAADILAARGVEAEVIDLRSLCPLDLETATASVRRTARALVVQEAPRTGGAGAEIACRIAEEAFEWLDAPLRRLAMPDVPVPCSSRLERAAVPDAGRIAAEALDLLGRKA